MRSLLAVLFVSAPAIADDHVTAGYMLAEPVAGDAGGADHVMVLRYEHLLGTQLDLGVATQFGYAPANDQETLTRFAAMPTLGVRSALGVAELRGDVGIGWQVLIGRTKVGGVPARGTEPRALRAELAIAAEAKLR